MKETHVRYYDIQEGSLFLQYTTDDILLGLMMSEATVNPDEKKLYITKAIVRNKKEEWLKILGYSLATYKRHFTDLRDKGLVNDEGTSYSFPQHFPKYFIGLDAEQVKKVCGLGLPHALQVYALLTYWSRTKGSARFVFTSKFIALAMGYSEQSTKNIRVIEEILEQLQALGLADFHQEYELLDTESKAVPRPIKVLH